MAELEFRDGQREVPDYLAVLMRGLDTYTMTYEQAVERANNSLLRWRIEGAQSAAVEGHFRKMRDGHGW